jgi:uncharacterized short protein YbdD (DUF466 family)
MAQIVGLPDFDNYETKYKNTLCVIYPGVTLNDGSEYRKLIHSFLDNNYPKVSHISLHSEIFSYGIQSTFMKCFNCNFKRVPINNYHEGLMENNKDEWRSGTCPKCDETCQWDINYDGWDGITRLYKNNIVVIGDYIKHHNRPRHAKTIDVTREEFDKVLSKKCRIFELPAPPKKLQKKGFIQKYIDEQLNPFNGT